MASSPHPVFVICGVGNGTGTGGYAARVFAKAGYDIALISTNKEHLDALAIEITALNVQCATIPIPFYSSAPIHKAFEQLQIRFPAPQFEIRAALFNATYGLRAPFLEVTDADVDRLADTDIRAAFAFARGCILAFKSLKLNDQGKRGFLMFTGSTGAIRGNVVNSIPSAGKFALRSLSQSLAKEFGKDHIHVAFSIIDGMILTDMWRERLGEEKFGEIENNVDERLHPESIAKAYLYLSQQDRSAWTWELDMRPAFEKW